MSSAENQNSEPSTLIPISLEPLCREASLSSLDTWITPTERFYIRNHFQNMPVLDTSDWRLAVAGRVSQPLNVSFDDILALPSVEMVMTLECAGNSRSYVTPPRPRA